jgi:hypothetical protein
MNVRGQTVLERCYGFCFRPNLWKFAPNHCEKRHFPRYLDVGLTLSLFLRK